MSPYGFKSYLLNLAFQIFHYNSGKHFRKTDRKTQTRRWIKHKRISPYGFANLSNPQKRNSRRNLRDPRTYPRYARASSSISSVILWLASSAVFIFAKRSFANESALYCGKRENASIPTWNLAK